MGQHWFVLVYLQALFLPLTLLVLPCLVLSLYLFLPCLALSSLVSRDTRSKLSLYVIVCESKFENGCNRESKIGLFATDITTNTTADIIRAVRMSGASYMAILNHSDSPLYFVCPPTIFSKIATETLFRGDQFSF